MKNVMVILANGFEEIECIAVVDVLRRAGSNVALVSISNSLEVTSQGNVKVVADKLLSNVSADSIDAVVLPGGYGGVMGMMESNELSSIVSNIHKKGKIISAICAAPLFLDKLDILGELQFTCYPSVKENIKAKNYTAIKPVIHDKNIITSQGPATALEFGLYLASILEGSDVSKSIREGMLHA
ncbi:DJ-1 family glyoxalase III [Helicobacter sp. WB40]|uniref:DJ-1 family glyoxalase III n=1 Tax=Helicobacter sp. WB40 TaxID=3004130 RepID=UPI0022EBE42B|nr:DJ-1 family glyoxalase III [Helicobacter sp. WB40]MDA3967848.1 DJ-1/PfpI family protein [Helicobacter sp. WB40]